MGTLVNVGCCIVLGDINSVHNDAVPGDRRIGQEPQAEARVVSQCEE